MKSQPKNKFIVASNSIGNLLQKDFRPDQSPPLTVTVCCDRDGKESRTISQRFSTAGPDDEYRPSVKLGSNHPEWRNFEIKNPSKN